MIAAESGKMTTWDVIKKMIQEVFCSHPMATKVGSNADHEILEVSGEQDELR